MSIIQTFVFLQILGIDNPNNRFFQFKFLIDQIFEKENRVGNDNAQRKEKNEELKENSTKRNDNFLAKIVVFNYALQSKATIFSYLFSINFYLETTISLKKREK